MNKAICLEQVFHRYGEREVLNNIQLSIDKGEIFGLLGPSGAGKTTIIKILTGQLIPSKGRAYVLGEDCSNLPERIHQAMGVMMDSLGLCERLSVYDNLAFFAKLQGVSKRKIMSALEAVGLEDAARTPVLKLSKGMRNRVSMARAILNDCEILFLDDPTSGLDPTTANEIHKLIRKQKERGCTVFMTTHNMEEAEALCRHVALLNQGSVVEYGTPEDICVKYNREPKFIVTLKSGEVVEIENNRAAVGILQGYMEAEAILRIHSVEPGLKEVFLQLMGGK